LRIPAGGHARAPVELPDHVVPGAELGPQPGPVRLLTADDELVERDALLFDPRVVPEIEDPCAVLARRLEEAVGELDAVLVHLLRDLPEEWIRATEGGDTWSCYDVVGHLIHGEATDWLPRVRMILEHGESRSFEPFDRLAQFREYRTQPIERLLDRFDELRDRNLTELSNLALSAADLARTGRRGSVIY